MKEAKELALTASENSFQTNVGTVFTNLVRDQVTDGSAPDTAQEAIARFRKGLELSIEALNQARTVISG